MKVIKYRTLNFSSVVANSDMKANIRHGHAQKLIDVVLTLKWFGCNQIYYHTVQLTYILVYQSYLCFPCVDEPVFDTTGEIDVSNINSMQIVSYLCPEIWYNRKTSRMTYTEKIYHE